MPRWPWSRDAHGAPSEAPSPDVLGVPVPTPGATETRAETRAVEPPVQRAAEAVAAPVPQAPSEPRGLRTGGELGVAMRAHDSTMQTMSPVGEMGGLHQTAWILAEGERLANENESEIIAQRIVDRTSVRRSFEPDAFYESLASLTSFREQGGFVDPDAEMVLNDQFAGMQEATGTFPPAGSAATRGRGTNAPSFAPQPQRKTASRAIDAKFADPTAAPAPSSGLVMGDGGFAAPPPRAPAPASRAVARWAGDPAPPPAAVAPPRAPDAPLAAVATDPQVQRLVDREPSSPRQGGGQTSGDGETALPDGAPRTAVEQFPPADAPPTLILTEPPAGSPGQESHRRPIETPGGGTPLGSPEQSTVTALQRTAATPVAENVTAQVAIEPPVGVTAVPVAPDRPVGQTPPVPDNRQADVPLTTGGTGAIERLADKADVSPAGLAIITPGGLAPSLDSPLELNSPPAPGGVTSSSPADVSVSRETAGTPSPEQRAADPPQAPSGAAPVAVQRQADAGGTPEAAIDRNESRSGGSEPVAPPPPSSEPNDSPSRRTVERVTVEPPVTPAERESVTDLPLVAGTAQRADRDASPESMPGLPSNLQRSLESPVSPPGLTAGAEVVNSAPPVVDQPEVQRRALVNETGASVPSTPAESPRVSATVADAPASLQHDSPLPLANQTETPGSSQGSQQAPPVGPNAERTGAVPASAGEPAPAQAADLPLAEVAGPRPEVITRATDLAVSQLGLTGDTGVLTDAATMTGERLTAHAVPVGPVEPSLDAALPLADAITTTGPDLARALGAAGEPPSGLANPSTEHFEQHGGPALPRVTPSPPDLLGTTPNADLPLAEIGGSQTPVISPSTDGDRHTAQAETTPADSVPAPEVPPAVRAVAPDSGEIARSIDLTLVSDQHSANVQAQSRVVERGTPSHEPDAQITQNVGSSSPEPTAEAARAAAAPQVLASTGTAELPLSAAPSERPPEDAAQLKATEDFAAADFNTRSETSPGVGETAPPLQRATAPAEPATPSTSFGPPDLTLHEVPPQGPAGADLSATFEPGRMDERALRGGEVVTARADSPVPDAAPSPPIQRAVAERGPATQPPPVLDLATRESPGSQEAGSRPASEPPLRRALESVNETGRTATPASGASQAPVPATASPSAAVMDMAVAMELVRPEGPSTEADGPIRRRVEGDGSPRPTAPGRPGDVTPVVARPGPSFGGDPAGMPPSLEWNNPARRAASVEAGDWPTQRGHSFEPGAAIAAHAPALDLATGGGGAMGGMPGAPAGIAGRAAIQRAIELAQAAPVRPAPVQPHAGIAPAGWDQPMLTPVVAQPPVTPDRAMRTFSPQPGPATESFRQRPSASSTSSGSDHELEYVERVVAESPEAYGAVTSVQSGNSVGDSSQKAALSPEDVESLSEKVWQYVRRELRLERERQRGRI